MPQALPPELIEQVAERFRVLGDATRLRMLRVLIDDGPLTVGDLVDHIGCSQPNVSKHLKVLADAGVVHRRTEGTSHFYSVTDPSLLSLCELVCGRLRTQAADDARAFAS